MIELCRLTKSYRVKGGRKYVLRATNALLPENANVALLGRNGAGKSTLLRILGGIDHPDSGEVRTHKSISWPLALTGGFQGSLSGRENAKFVCQVYGTRGEATGDRIGYVHKFSELGHYFDMPVKTYSTGMRARLGFALSMAFPFDVYLVDEVTSVGDQGFKRKCAHAFKALRGRASIIMASHSMQSLRQHCDMGMVLGDGNAQLFDDVDEAVEAYEALA